MKNGKTAARYAKALLDLSIEGGTMDEIFANMQDLTETIENSADLKYLLKNPVVKSEEKKNVFTTLFGKSFNELSSKTISLLITNKRENIMSEVAEQFIVKYKEHKNIITAEVTSAVKLDESQKAKVIALLNHDGEVELIEEIDTKLIGGFIVKVGDKQIDASIARKFKNLRKEIILN